MKFLAIIPSRFASTRFPGKPLVEIDGKPMIQLVYERTSKYFEQCYVATDDARIEEAVKSFGGRVVMTSTSHRSGTDRCAEALATVERESGTSFEVVVNVQGDEPFICEEHLIKIKSLFDSDDSQIGTLVKAFSDDEDIFNPNLPKVVVSADEYAMYFSRSVIPYLRSEDKQEWQNKHKYLKHIGLYAYRAEILRKITELPASTLEIAESLEQLRWLENGYKIKVAETQSETIAIDTPEDLEKLLSRL